MIVRLCHDFIALEAMDPDHVEVKVTAPGAGEGGTRHHYVLSERDQHAVGLFVAILISWRARLALGMGPPPRFDQDLTPTQPGGVVRLIGRIEGDGNSLTIWDPGGLVPARRVEIMLASGRCAVLDVDLPSFVNLCTAVAFTANPEGE